jgi:trimeric autotransporter adhesin
MKLRIGCLVAGFLSLVLSLTAQTANNVSASSQVPSLIQLSNVATDQGGNTLSGMVSITFSLYAAQRDGEPLWTETQNNVQLDAAGHYSVQLGITKSNGVPTTLFTTGEARWLGVRIAEQGEQPRVLLLSVPYALKAGDAATIGGLPPSAFVLAAPALNAAALDANAATQSSAPPPASGPVTGAGTVNYLPLWDSISDIVSSVILQSGTGTTAKIGIGTTTPATTLDIKGSSTVRGNLSLPATGTATASKGANSQPLSLTASAYNSATSVAANQVFRWQAEPVNNTVTPSGTLNLLFAEGTATPAETGLKIASNGQITFATGQTFPGGGGSGTVTSIATGQGLLGGTITTSGTLAIDTTVVPQLAVSNTFTANQTVKGTLTAKSGGNTIVGDSSSTSGIGVEGSATAVTGDTVGVLGVSNSPDGYGVYGEELATTGTTAGVSGYTISTAGYGVLGNAAANTGTTAGVYGAGSSPSGYGVEGTSPNVGVYGQTSTPGGYGVDGQNAATTGTGTGVYGSTASAAGIGVYGQNNSPGGYAVEGSNGAQTDNGAGVVGFVQSPVGFAVVGQNLSQTGPAAGIAGASQSTAGTGVVGEAVGPGFDTFPTLSTAGAPYGVVGASPAVGIYGASGLTPSATGSTVSHNNGVWGDYGGSAGTGYGVLGTADDNGAGVFVNNSSIGATISVTNDTATAGGAVFQAFMPNLLGDFGFATIGDPGCGESSGNMGLQLGQYGDMSGCLNYTLVGDGSGNTYLNASSGAKVHVRVNNVDQLVASAGNIDVLTTLTKPAGSFKIDHPLDPANKYLYHSFVESPDMMNIYNGNVTTDDAGLAKVTLPDWFETLNRDFRYQLTVIGQFAQAIVASEISGNQFGIRTDKPNVKVSWQVTGVRQDAFANAHRIQVEVEKAPADRGRYLYPEVFGQPATARIGFEAPPSGGEQVVHHQRAIPRRSNAFPMMERMQLRPPSPNVQKPILPSVAPVPHPSAQTGPKAPTVPVPAAVKPAAAQPK